MNRNKHLLLWSSLAVLALLATAIVQEHFLREWRRIQKQAQARTSGLDVRLRQIVSPALHLTDRCVSCHVGMSPGEQLAGGTGMLAGHPPVVHDPAEIGCTVCHGGQGRATEKADAHGLVPFWPEPVIPKRYAYAGCGSCHTHLRVPEQTALQRGRDLVERHDCLACHSLDGRGGTLRPGFAGISAPDFSRVGLSGYDPDWYAKHLSRQQQATDDRWRNSFRPIDLQDRHAIDVFLASRVGAPNLVEAKALFHSLGCRGCHKVNGVGGDDGPDLSREGQKDPARLSFAHVTGQRTLTNWLVEHFRWPARVVPGSQMPDLGLTDEQIELLTFYMMSLRQPSEHWASWWPKDRLRALRLGEREFATDGRTLYGTFCAACHGSTGQGMRYSGMGPFPAIGNPDFLAVASDEFITATITRGRPGRRMPAWGEKEGGLRTEEIAAIVAHLRSLGGPAEPDDKPRRWIAADADAGKQLYSAYCAGCHGKDGQGGEAPALNHPVLLSTASDTYLVKTIARGRRGTAMQGFAQASPVHPALSNEQIQSIVAFLRTWEKPQP